MQIDRTTHFDQPALRVRTRSACWTYQLEAGGFSSLTDPDGVEWIGFAPGEPIAPAGAANVFRGVANLVYPDNVGHPGYRLCRSEWQETPQGLVITTASTDGQWQWRWTISETEAQLAMVSAPRDRTYWFLYEGTPGGRYDPDGTVWGTSAFETASTAPPLQSPMTGEWRWAYFGHRSSDLRLLLVHESADGEPSLCGFMAADRADGDGMVVFGFGRESAGRPVPRLAGSHRFRVALVRRGSPDDPAGPSGSP